LEMKVKNPSAVQKYGSYKDSNIAITPQTHPDGVLLYSWDDTFIPNFEFKNPSEYTNRYMKLKMVRGMKFKLKTIREHEAKGNYDILNIGEVSK